MIQSSPCLYKFEEPISDFYLKKMNFLKKFLAAWGATFSRFFFTSSINVGMKKKLHSHEDL